MPSIIMDLLFFVIVLGIAVTIHEWGHFIIARKMGVRVLRFSVGFGKPLVKIKRGETEYCIAPIPLGGYVKMAGESYEEELSGEPWEFLSASPLRRIAIVFAGPAMNLVLAAVIFFLIYFLIGKPYTATHELGEVIPGSLGDVAGLQAGDVITSLNGKEVNQWDDIELILDQAFLDERSIEVVYDRQGEPGKAVLPVEIVDVGEAKFLKCAPVMDVIDLVGPAWDLGLQRGDLILSVSGEPIQYWHELYEKVRQKVKIDRDGNPQPIPFPLTWSTPDGEEQTKTVTPLLTKEDDKVSPKIGVLAARFGLIPAEAPVIGKVKGQSPAQKAGLHPDDRILMVDQVPIVHARQFQEIILRSSEKNEEGETVGKPITVTWLTPENETESQIIQPTITHTQVPTTLGLRSGNKVAFAEIGIQMKRDREKYGLVGAAMEGIRQTGDWCVQFVVLFKRLITGEYSVHLVGGPIAIAQGSASQARWGIEEFFRWIAILSANLAVINLFPIPILDGGHIMIYLIELIRRKKMSIRALEWAYRLAFFLFLLPLIIMIFYVDIDRLGGFDFIKRWFGH